MNQATILVALGCVLGAGCKPKEKAPSQAKSGLAALSGMRTAPATADGLIVVGTPKLGCFAWSTARHTAACVTGWQAPGKSELSLNYLDATAGAPPSTPINFADDIDATEARTNNEALAAGGFASLSTLAAPRHMSHDTPVVVAGGTFLWSARTKDGDKLESVTVECDANRHGPVLDALAGVDAKVTIRELGRQALVELSVTTNGEHGAEVKLGAALVDPSTCNEAAIGM